MHVSPSTPVNRRGAKTLMMAVLRLTDSSDNVIFLFTTAFRLSLNVNLIIYTVSPAASSVCWWPLIPVLRVQWMRHNLLLLLAYNLLENSHTPDRLPVHSRQYSKHHLTGNGDRTLDSDYNKGKGTLKNSGTSCAGAGKWMQRETDSWQIV